jgi:hypothetical protein
MGCGLAPFNEDSDSRVKGSQLPQIPDYQKDNHKVTKTENCCKDQLRKDKIQMDFSN